MTTTTEDLLERYADLLPTPEDVAFYQENGYWISGRILPPEVLDSAERGMASFYAGHADRPMPDGSDRVGWRAEHGDVLRKNDYTSLIVDDLATLVRHPLIGACAARLNGEPEIRLWHDQLLYKPSEDGLTESGKVNVGWHTDRQYWRSAASADMLTAWVPFHDVGEREGAVSFVAGSHRWEDDVVLDFFNPDLSTLDAVRKQHDVEVVVAEIPRGAMSIHHCRTVHGSGPNRSGAPRRSMAIHMQPGSNRFVEHTRPDGTLAFHPNDQYVRRDAAGHPDYTDPAACPRLWPPAA
ncbi:Ectoine hydroxylase-related dioxygenase, phytanoyl-CoA dioxygenase (PhyH) family [Actinopolymorpha cephalotaxi]|uniref:Ectoine hydroxylase-related dioxygenase (Phytanoyl-CoA dioxygenase family) n=1 Tax=Actinopolymorpha cephalotaxi TaxID=504797 RepID=A0A1I2S110_9ACTN|nr:phytanoyl-CoA dioxygenase family protein [Actinopolymorpha cephalotaxi]NYH83864.1 ectoine hydroxylase-related dioxygenase (phytanoyl-CoA dioxygenase family) [Actinopolymorpha cephalotaxi]SFG46502.1 Ectoine hydroxylase-related dioxygenase, phytanoyl-CoA dioxygenase (PhyH) family [Actinopolymorpha cephalotaxi]